MNTEPAGTDLVQNAADVRQVTRAGRKQQDVVELRHALLHTQLSTVAGREFVWQELGRHRIFESITTESTSLTYALSGRRDAGLELLADVQQHARLYLQMQSEAIDRDAHQARANAAAHTQSVSQESAP